MGSVAENLDLIQERLHDGEKLWTREELARWFNDGYREFLAKSQAVRRIHLIDLPPRYTFTYTYEWEARHVSGPSRMIFLPALNGTMRCTSLWEAEQLEGVTPTNAYAGKTQEWERAYGNETDRHVVFALPRQHDMIVRVAWDNKILLPVAVREFDETDDAWMRRGGEPWWWTPGLGRINTIEIYEIQTAYTQQYALLDYEGSGFARFFSGEREYAVDSEVVNNDYAYTTSGDADALAQDATPYLTGLGWRFTKQPDAPNDGHFCTYQWEVDRHNGDTLTDSDTATTYGWEAMHGGEAVSFGVGTVRSIVSPDRQYWALGSGPATNNLYGGIRDLRSSTESVEVTHVVVPDVTLDDDDTPDLIPEQLQKYLRYYVWQRAYGRQGPGMQPALAAHYAMRFERGVQFFKRLADTAHQDHVFVRDEVDGGGDSRPPYVRLPSNYEQAL